MNKVYLMDCMEGMRNTPDKWYDLAVVDPPYGIGVNQMNMGSRKTVKPSKKDWDNEIPTAEYFNELMRLSKNQIIWGGNYFTHLLPPSQYFAIWDKGETMYGRDFAEMEFAWVSGGGTRIFKKTPNQLNRTHPTQKPIALYDWIFQKYATKGMKILDTHAGSMSSVISAIKNDMIITAYEIDSDYFNAGKKRIEAYLQQGNIFQQPQIEFIS